MTAQNIDKILDCYTKRKTIEHFSRLTHNDEVAEQNYNISVGTYVAQKDTRELVDIAELNAQIAKIVARQNTLRTEIDEIVADLEGASA